MPKIIDFHTHAFPDAVAASAIPALENIGGVAANLDGKISSLLTSMDRAGIAKSIICSIATKPSQFETILSWSKQIRSKRIIPLASIHPASSNAIDQIAQIKNAGFLGIKMHPYYQDFSMDEERMFPLYEKICQENLLLLMHTGFDIGFPRDQRAAPQKIARVMDTFPDLKLICSHFGAWEQWDEVEELLIGRPIYMDISYSLHIMPPERAADMILRHPEEYILFGSDSPWTDQQEAIKQVEQLAIPSTLQEAILGGNAAKLLAL